MEFPKGKIYCSLDIETSGFDPLKNEVLEVGFVLFEFENGQVKVLEEYGRVFKPNLPVSPNILGLTGIKQDELDQAESFLDHKELLQQKLGNAVIIGHNVNFDIKFLEVLGINFSGEVVDTLDLVQFLLPTHHSYNLENLMHYFGVEHKNAHRALADAKASLKVLENLFDVFSKFTLQLQDQINNLGNIHNFCWVGLTQQITEKGRLVKVTDLEIKKNDQTAIEVEQDYEIQLKPRTILNFPFTNDLGRKLAFLLNKKKKKVLLVLPRTSQVVKLWKTGQIKPIFSEDILFDEEKFDALLKKTDLVIEEIKFILKILVWKETNWQTECIFDLNLSFFGGQFKKLVTGKESKENNDSIVMCCDFQAFTEISKKHQYSERFAVIIGLDELEQYISGSLSVQASWTYVSYLFKAFYNPETGYGELDKKDLVIRGLTKADLFFGIVNALLKSDPQKFQYVTIDQNFLYSENGQKVAAAAEGFALEIISINEVLRSEELATFANNLKDYFKITENHVKWIELAPNRCLLMSAPIDISQASKDALKVFPKLALADCLGTDLVTGYFKKRLGLLDYGVETVKFKQIQGQLFNKLPAKQVIKCQIQGTSLPATELFAKLTNISTPSAVLFGTVSQVKDFYEQYYKELSKNSFLVAQNNQSGSNRMFHNFSIHKNSLLLATGKFVLKHVFNSSSVDPVEHLAVKNLYICNLPFEQYTHPYQQAVSAQFSNSFEEYSLPRAIYNLQVLLKFFNTGQLENVYLYDNKLSKGYGSEFKECISMLDGYEL